MIKRSFILPGVLISLTVFGLLSLGFWQLDRAEEKRTIESAIVVAQSNTAQLVEADDIHTKEHYRVLLNGYFDTHKQFIYDNQIVKGNAGYYVLTPFVLNTDTAILISANSPRFPYQGTNPRLTKIAVSVLRTNGVKT